MIDLMKAISESLRQTILALGCDSDIAKNASGQLVANEDIARGHISSSIALSLYQRCFTDSYQSPFALANEIADKLTSQLTPQLTGATYSVSVAKPGYLNILLSQEMQDQMYASIFSSGENYGQLASTHKKILVEYVSANPTGPLHVGRSRGAVVGMALCNILRKAGYTVASEYYVNDGGKQIEVLLVSVLLAVQKKQLIPGCYQETEHVVAQLDSATLSQIQAMDLGEATGSDDDLRLSSLVERGREFQQWRNLLSLVVDKNLDCIKEDLNRLAITFDSFTYESKLINNASLVLFLEEHCGKAVYRDNDHTLWFASSKYGDEKDRVLVRKNGVPTYFAFDLYYHYKKISAGYDILINIWGADHHGYIPRLQKALAVIAHENPIPPLEILLVQFVVLKNDEGLIQSMSTRSGTAVPLAELLDAVGEDVTKVYYLQRGMQQQMDFDLAAARKESQQNPYYYLQYAHARCVSILKMAQTRYGSPVCSSSSPTTHLLTNPHEKQLLQTLRRFPIIIKNSSDARNPTLPLHYLRDLASQFHLLYHEVSILVDDAPLRTARLTLISAIMQVFQNGFALYKITPLDRLDRSEDSTS